MAISVNFDGDLRDPLGDPLLPRRALFSWQNQPYQKLPPGSLWLITGVLSARNPPKNGLLSSVYCL